MTQAWPPIRTHMSEHHGYEMGHAASIGLVAVLIGLPLAGLGISWIAEGQDAQQGVGLSLYTVVQMLAYSPLLSWLGLLFGIPMVYAAIRRGFGGWLVTMAIGAAVGAAILLMVVWLTMDFAGLRIVVIGAGFGAIFAGVYWLAMRLTTPELFRTP